MKLLPPFAAPTLGTWSAAISLADVRLDQTSALLVALNGAGPRDVVAVYVSENGALTPSGADDLAELFAPPQVATNQDGQPVITGPNPVVIQFSSTDPPTGTYLYFYRVKGTSSPQIQVSGENNPPVPAGGTAFLQGGNSFGATAVLGTLDAHNLSIITNGAVRFGISAAGSVVIGAGGPDTTDVVLQAGRAGGEIALSGAVVIIGIQETDPAVPTASDPIPQGDIDAVSFFTITSEQPLQPNGAPYQRVLVAPTNTTAGRIMMVLADPANPYPVAVGDAGVPELVPLVAGQATSFVWTGANWRPMGMTIYPVFGPNPAVGPSPVTIQALGPMTVFLVGGAGGPPIPAPSLALVPNLALTTPGYIIRYLIPGPTKNPVLIQNNGGTTLATVNPLTGNQFATVDIIQTPSGAPGGDWVLYAASIPVS